MTHYYSDPSREKDKYSLPDIEVFEAGPGEWDVDDEPNEPGWYWWACFPGCMPEGDAMGPFDTEEDALADARDGVEP
jgi:hypothetical protein